MARNYSTYTITSDHNESYSSGFTDVTYTDSTGTLSSLDKNSINYVPITLSTTCDGFFRRRLYIDNKYKFMLWTDDSYGGSADNTGVASGSVRVTDSQWAFRIPKEKLKYLTIHNIEGGKLGVYIMKSGGGEIAYSIPVQTFFKGQWVNPPMDVGYNASQQLLAFSETIDGIALMALSSSGCLIDVLFGTDQT